MKQRHVITGIVVLSLIVTTLPLVSHTKVVAAPNRPWNVVEAFWGTTTMPMEVSPGDQNVPLSIIIQYLPEDSVPATGISIKLDLEQHFTAPIGTDPVAYPTVLGGAATQSQTDFNPGDTGVVQFVVNINPICLLNHPYKMELRVMYYEDSTATGGDLDYKVDKVPFEVRILGRPRFDVDFLETTLVTEKTNNLVIKIGNNGTAAANDVHVELTVPPPLILTEGTTSWEIEQIPVQETHEIVVPLYAPMISATSTYQLVILLTYRDQNGIIQNKTHYGGVVVHGNTGQPTSDLQVDFSVGNITAGKNTPLSIRMTNLGSGNVYDVSMALELPPPLILMGTDNQWYFEQIRTQGSEETNVNIYAPESATGYTYPIIATMTFKDHMGADQMTSRTLGLLVIGDIDLLVYELITFPVEVPVGGNFTVSGNILNRGNVEAMYANVTIVEDPHFYVTASSTYYVGQIDPNAPIPFAVTGFLQPDVGEGTYPLTIEVKYRDNFGGRYTLITTLPVIVVSAEQGTAVTPTPTSLTQRITNTLFRPIPLFITAVVIIVLWRILRKSEEEE